MTKINFNNPFVQEQWKTRVVDYPNRRLLKVLREQGDEIIADVSRYDGESTGGIVSEPGTPINATRFNSLEGRISSAFTQVANYINNNAEVKFENLTEDIENINVNLEDLNKAVEPISQLVTDVENLKEGTYFVSNETIELHENIYAGIIDKINTGVYVLSFFIPFNKTFDKNIEGTKSITLDGEFKIFTYQGSLTNESYINFSTLTNTQIILKDLGVTIKANFTDFLPTSTDDCCCSVIFKDRSKITINIDEEGAL